MDINIKEYISSGILELYVSGALPEEETREVRLLSQKYPELLKEIEEIESAILAYAASFVEQDQKVPLLKTEDLNKPIISNLQALNPSSISQTDTKRSESLVKSFNWRIFAVAASILLLVSIVLNLYFFQQWQDSRQYIAILDQERGQIAEDYERLETNYHETLNVMGDPAYIRVPMENEESQDLLTYVYWNPSTEKVFVKIHKLPEINEEEVQYQLWAIKEGTNPISMGVFHMNDTLQLQEETVGGEVIMFAVTEEPKGGSTSPTLENMRVAGSVPENNQS